jgi:hypothetical protein
METWDEAVDRTYSASVQAKAFDLAESGRLRRDAEMPTRFRIPGSKADTSYRVQVLPGSEDAIPWVTCSCPNGMNKGGRPTCYHSLAALLVIRQEWETEG